MNSENEVPVVSQGKIFKEKNGYSKTMKRNMLKQGLNPNQFSDSLNTYRDIRKKRRRAEALDKRKKHELAKANRGKKASGKLGGKKN